MDIVCILGLSPKAIREECNFGICAVESAVLHNQMNSEIKLFEDEICGEYINGFMTISEVRTLMQNDNVFLALHGCCHLHLQDISSIIEQSLIFKRDVESGIKALNEYGLNTDIFVYPYAYEPFLSRKILREHGFRYIFAGNDSKRIPIEELVS